MFPPNRLWSTLIQPEPILNEADALYDLEIKNDTFKLHFRKWARQMIRDIPAEGHSAKRSSFTKVENI